MKKYIILTLYVMILFALASCDRTTIKLEPTMTPTETNIPIDETKAPTNTSTPTLDVTPTPTPILINIIPNAESPAPIPNFSSEDELFDAFETAFITKETALIEYIAKVVFFTSGTEWEEDFSSTDKRFLFYVYENYSLYSDLNKEYTVSGNEIESFLHKNHVRYVNFKDTAAKYLTLAEYDNETDTVTFSGIKPPDFKLGYNYKFILGENGYLLWNMNIFLKKMGKYHVLES